MHFYMYVVHEKCVLYILFVVYSKTLVIFYITFILHPAHG